DAFEFGAKTAVGEPVFAARPGGAVDEGWLIVQGLDGASGKAFFALFDAASVGAGPIAKLWLGHHLTLSFPGAWGAAENHPLCSPRSTRLDPSPAAPRS